MAEIRLSRRAEKDLDGLPKRAATRVVDALGSLGDDPGSSQLDVKALTGRRPWRRMGVGDYRVLFKVVERGRIVLVGRVIDRRDFERALSTLD